MRVNKCVTNHSEVQREVQLIDGQVHFLYNTIGKLLIGLISDTHIGYPSDILPPHIKGASFGQGVRLMELPREVLDALSGVDLILHAGDVYLPLVLDQLEEVAPVLGSWGDDDVPDDFGDDNRLKKRQILTYEGVTLWLTHVRPTFWLIDPDDEYYYLDSQFEDPDNSEASDVPPDIIVHGHSHIAAIDTLREVEHDKEIMVVNPGSATFPNYVAKLGSVGLLTIESGKVDMKIVPLD